MILVVDSGSTKTDWIALSEDGKQLFQTQTLGLNPQILSQELIVNRITENSELYASREDVTRLYFYGAGCGVEKPSVYIATIFKNFFSKAADIVVKGDSYAAVYATAAMDTSSIVCILGTGSNCSYFNGKNIIQKIISLGYILMDDASGNYYGKALLRDYKYHKMPAVIAHKFENEYDLDSETIKQHIYKEPNPNAYLATFARFMVENKEVTYMQNLIKKGLREFIENHVLQFNDAREIPIHFVGSIAFYLKEELSDVFKEKELLLGNIVKRPIEGLVEYHKRLLLN